MQIKLIPAQQMPSLELNLYENILTDEKQQTVFQSRFLPLISAEIQHERDFLSLKNVVSFDV